MTVKVTLIFADFFRLQLNFLKKRMLPWYGVLVTILLLTGILPFFLMSDNERYNPAFAEWLLTPMLCILGMPVIMLTVIYFSAKTNFNNDKLIKKESTYSFDDVGFEISSESAQVRIRWEEVFRFENLNTMFLIYLSPAKALIIPKRFVAETGATELLNMLSYKVRTPKVKWFKRPVVLKTILYVGIIAVPLIYPFIPQGNTSRDYLMEGYEKEKNGDHAGAIRDFTKSIETDPAHARAYTWRGSAKYSSGDKEGGCADFFEAQRLGDTVAKALILEYCMFSDSAR